MTDLISTDKASRARRIRVPIAIMFGLTIGLLVFISIGGMILYLSDRAEDNVLLLLRDNSLLRIDRLQTSLDRLTSENERRAETAASELSRVPLGRTQEALEILRTTIGSAETPLTISYVQANDYLISANRDLNGIIETRQTNGADIQQPEAFRVWVKVNNRTPEIAYSVPIGSGQTRRVIVSVPLSAISKLLDTTADQQLVTPFLLADKENVLAHPTLATGEGPNNPTIGTVDDPVLAAMWQPTPRRAVLPDDVSGHIDGPVGSRELYIYQKLRNHSETDWLIGFHSPASVYGAAVDQVWTAAAGGLIGLFVAIVAAITLGFFMGRPIRRLASAAREMETLSFKDVPALQSSRMKEIDDANSAFRSATHALTEFAKFVPRDLVTQLLAGSAIGADRSEMRELTIMFTDLAGFTTLASTMSPEETSHLLDQYFELVTELVDAENGTVDKFLGDGVMAFWGAPMRQSDHALRALRTSLAIADAFEEGALGGVRLRIGLCTGDVMVGTTGSEIRKNYTVIGDSVNMAERLQELGKSVDPEAPVIVLASASTIDSADFAEDAEDLGEWTLRGRHNPTRIFRVA